MNIYKADTEFKFSDLELTQPIAMTGNTYFTAVSMSASPVYIETPQTLTKQGFVKNSKKMVCDISSIVLNEFIQWFETETTFHKLVFEKAPQWFETALELGDIENAFIPCLKTFKSGKYQVCRCNIPIDHHTGNPTTKVFNDNELIIPHGQINDESNVISILEVRGVKLLHEAFK